MGVAINGPGIHFGVQQLKIGKTRDVLHSFMSSCVRMNGGFLQI